MAAGTYGEGLYGTGTYADFTPDPTATDPLNIVAVGHLLPRPQVLAYVAPAGARLQVGLRSRTQVRAGAGKVIS